jgi:hypothetical protein
MCGKPGKGRHGTSLFKYEFNKLFTHMWKTLASLRGGFEPIKLI